MQHEELSEILMQKKKKSKHVSEICVPVRMYI